MVVCRFFQQGNCRYGNSCRNEHVYPNKYTYKPQQQPPQPQKYDPGNSQKEIANLVRAVINDSTCAIKGKQWLLTCYGPFKEKGNFPQFEDYSFEEIRLAMYEAQKLGTTQNHMEHFRQLWGTALQKFQSLLDPNIEIIKVIKDIYYAGSEPQQTTTPAFGGTQNQNASNSVFSRLQNPPANTNFSFVNNSQPPPNTSVFSRVGNPPVGNSIFNQGFNQQPPVSSNIFGGNQSAFAQTPAAAPSIFGGTNLNQQPNNVFGNANSQFNPQVQPNQSIFGGGQAVNNAFGRPLEKPQQSTSPLAAFQSQPAPNVFGQPTPSVPLFNNQPSNAFGTPQSNPVQQPNAFGTPQSNPVQQPNAFGTPQPNPAQQPNAFGQHFSLPNPNNQVVQPTFNQPTPSNIFGGANQMSQAPFGQFEVKPTVDSNAGNDKTGYDESIYSKMEDLSEEEINAFNSENFELGQIPEHPPALQMC